MKEIIHFSDWASQPEVRIACTQQCDVPWTKRKDLPSEVHEIPQKNSSSILYTFNSKKVTCNKCKNNSAFIKDLQIITDYERKVAESGLTSAQYVMKLQKDLLEKLNK